MSDIVEQSKQRRSKPRIAWRDVKRDYLHCEPPPTLRELAEKHGISESSIMARSAKEGWPTLREAQHAKAEIAANENEIERRAKEYAEWDDRHLSAARLIHIAAMTELTSSLQAKGSMPDTQMSSTDMEKYARMAKTAMEIERTVHGRTTSVVDQTMHGELLNITPEHLEAMRQRQEQRIREQLAAEAQA